MYNAFGLVEGSQVRIAGVNAGTVTGPRHQRRQARRGHGRAHRRARHARRRRRTARSEPQSLIAEYFISCEPAGPPIAEDDDADDPDADIPASQVAADGPERPRPEHPARAVPRAADAADQRVRDRARRQPDSLNEAIRLGAPALTDLRKVTRILASQNTIIRDLNANSDQVIGRLAERREDVVRFIQEARDTAEASAARREDLSRDFELLDDFLAELRPTLVELDNLAVEQTPLLTDLRAAAPGLNRLATNLPPFNDATEGVARRPRRGLGGRRAGAAPRRATRSSSSPTPGRKAPLTAEILADFLRDLDDPRRAVEIDDRVDRRHRAHRPARRASPTPRATPGSRASSTTSTTRPARSTSTTRSATCSTSASTTSSPARAARFSSGRDPRDRRARGPGRGRRHDHRHPRGRQLRLLARPEPARDQRGPRPAQVRPVGVPERHRAAGRRAGALQPRRPAELARPRGRRSAAGGRGEGAAPASGRAGARRRRRRPAAPAAAAGAGGSGPRRSRHARRRRRRRHPRPDPRPAARGARRAARATSRISSAAAATGAAATRGATADLLDFLSQLMRGRGVSNAITASPTMVGAVTTLIVIVAVFLAYNANAGLPFVPVYRVSVEIPDAARLTNNNEVRIGGHRVGVVESIDAIQAPQAGADRAGGRRQRGGRDHRRRGRAAQPEARQGRRAAAQGLGLPGPLPLVVRAQVPGDHPRRRASRRPRASSSTASTTRPTGRPPATCPATRASPRAETAQNGCFQPQTEFDDIDNTFDTPTRTNARTNLVGFGNAFAGRGTSLNDAINSLEPLFRGLKPVTAVLLEPSTRSSRRFFPELGDAARIVAPVAVAAGRLLHPGRDRLRRDLLRPGGAPGDDLRGRADARDRDRDPARASARSCASFAILSRELRPGVTDLRATLPVLNEAIEVGTPVLRALAGDQPSASRARCGALNRLVSQPTTKVALQRLEETFDLAMPLAQVGGPGADRLQLLELLVHVPARTALRPRPGRVTPSARCWPSFPVAPTVEAPVDGYSGLQASGRQARRRGGKFEPYAIPILNAHPYQPTGQRNADCQGGQFGYALGAEPGPRPGRSTTRLRRHRPARLARPDDAVHQRRRRARAPGHAHRLAPARDLGDGTDEARTQSNRLPSWVIGLVLLIVIAIASVPRLHQGAALGRRLRGQGRLRLGAERAARARRCGSPGVNVGEVTSVEHLTSADERRAHRRRPASSRRRPVPSPPASRPRW